MLENKKEALQKLRQQLKNYPAQNKAYGCLVIMCDGALKCLASPDEPNIPASYSRRTLKELVDSPKRADAMDSKDLSKWLQLRDLNQYLNNFIQTHADAFKYLSVLPVVMTNQDKKGGRGNETLFWLGVTDDNPLLLEADGVSEQDSVWSPYIAYTRTPSDEIKLAFFVRPFFKQGEMVNKSARGLLFWIGLNGLVLVAVFYLLALAISLVNFGQSMASLHVFLMLLMVGFFVFFFKDLLWPIWLLPDYRVIKAPTYFLSLMEMDAEIEMHRDQQRHQHTRFTRFKSTCAICGADVFLRTGKPDQKAPLVGRCSESPHAHVYSFDRVSLTGVLLNEWAKTPQS